MKSNGIPSATTAMLIVCSPATSRAASRVLYVDDAVGSDDGSSWDDAHAELSLVSLSLLSMMERGPVRTPQASPCLETLSPGASYTALPLLILRRSRSRSTVQPISSSATTTQDVPSV